MSIVTGLLVFVMVWWVMLFMVLPWGIHYHDSGVQGAATSAPAQPRLRLKLLVTTAISVVVWLIIYLIIIYGDWSIRDLANFDFS